MKPTIPQALRERLQQLSDDMRAVLDFLPAEVQDENHYDDGEWEAGDDMLAVMVDDLDAAKSALWSAQTRCGGKRGIQSCDSETLFPDARGWAKIRPTTGPYIHVWLCPTCAADPVARWPYLSNPEDPANNPSG